MVPPSHPGSGGDVEETKMEATTMSGVSRQVLEDTVFRALMLLRGIGTDMVIRGVMAKAGYTDEDHAQGWNLLHKVGGYTPVAAPSTINDDARGAIVELDAWDEPGFRRAHAALQRLHPEQDAFVFENLSASQGTSAVLGVTTFLDRLDALESGAGRDPKKKESDRAALETLAKRGIGKGERTRLRGLVARAQTTKSMPVDATVADARTAELVALRSWYEDWSETARAVFKRRDHLIKLGLAKRKAPEKREQPAEPQPTDEGDVG
jgi:hypothetical protein